MTMSHLEEALGKSLKKIERNRITNSYPNNKNARSKLEGGRERREYGEWQEE
jgi:hypothetical protein